MFDQIPSRQKSQPQRLPFGNVSVPGTKAGAVVSIGLVVVAWMAVPLARPFLLGAGGLGTVLGVFLYWLHNRE